MCACIFFHFNGKKNLFVNKLHATLKRMIISLLMQYGGMLSDTSMYYCFILNETYLLVYSFMYATIIRMLNPLLLMNLGRQYLFKTLRFL